MAAHWDAGTPLSTPPTSGLSHKLAPVTVEQHVDSGPGGGNSGAAASSRWPKTEVHALIHSCAWTWTCATGGGW
jgi:trans-aconitate methyltransferase